MSSADWFRARLQGWQPQQQQPQYPAQQYPQQQYAQQAPPQQYYDEEQQRSSYGSQALAAIKSGSAGLRAITVLFRGSDKVRRLENENCPECGDPRYFNRTDPKMSKINAAGQRCAPAPVCMACGYTGGMFEQSGSQPLDGSAPVQVDHYSMSHQAQKHVNPNNPELWEYK